MSMPNATDAKYAAAGDWDRVSPRRVGHYLRAQRNVSHRDPDFVSRKRSTPGCSGAMGTALQGDALEIIHHTPATALYADPPIGDHGLRTHLPPAGRLLGDPPPPDRTWISQPCSSPRSRSRRRAVVRRTHRVARPTRGHRAPVPTRDPHVGDSSSHLPAIATEVTNAERYEYLIVAGES